MGLQIQVLTPAPVARSMRPCNFVRERPDAFFVGPTLYNRRVQIGLRRGA